MPCSTSLVMLVTLVGVLAFLGFLSLFVKVVSTSFTVGIWARSMGSLPNRGERCSCHCLSMLNWLTLVPLASLSLALDASCLLILFWAGQWKWTPCDVCTDWISHCLLMHNWHRLFVQSFVCYTAWAWVGGNLLVLHPALKNHALCDYLFCL